MIKSTMNLYYENNEENSKNINEYNQNSAKITKDRIEQIKNRTLIIRKKGITSEDLNRIRRDEVIKKLDAVPSHQLRLVDEFINGLLRDEAKADHEHPSSESLKTVPQWAERTTGREVTPVDWIKMHYGRMIDGEWDPDGLTQADIGRSDPKLYHAYIARIRRLPEENLGLPVEPRTQAMNPEEALEMKRKASRDYVRRQRAKKQLIL